MANHALKKLKSLSRYYKMRVVENRFGKDELYEEQDIIGSVRLVNTACSSIQAEVLSWVYGTKRQIDPNRLANNIIVFGCQVTDLAILNDLMVLSTLMLCHPKKEYYVGGCLARRFDIPLPENVRRLNSLRCDTADTSSMEDDSLVEWASPFWVRSFSNYNKTTIGDGHLFRNSYFCRISSGCSKKCAYCTIRDVRGPEYELPIDGSKLISHHGNTVLVADSPSESQIDGWCREALKYERQISIRNVEPSVIIACREILLHMARRGLLEVLHSPVQSDNPEVLRDMKRPVEDTMFCLASIYPELRQHCKIATNVIIDYKDFPNPTKVWTMFDHVSWNPYWDGVWDINRAIARWNHYFPWNRLDSDKVEVVDGKIHMQSYVP